MLDQIKRFFKVSVGRLLETRLKQGLDVERTLLEDSIMIEDEICFIFGVSRRSLTLAMIQHNCENEFYC